MSEGKNPGNANLPIGGVEGGIANREIGGPEGANREIGGPEGANREIGGPERWHSRGYLPHFESADAIQHVTFHLADSLPKDVLDRLSGELKSLPLEKQDAERRKRIEAWMDAGHGSCVLREPSIAAMVQSTLLHFDAERYRLLAWVVMPNHVHVLFQPLNGWTVAKIVASWKKFTARKINDHKRFIGNANLPIGEVKGASRETGVPGVWHREYWDRYIRNEGHYQQAIEYIHQNPVKARLVTSATDWPWSSAGTANLPIGEVDGKRANREIGGPGCMP